MTKFQITRSVFIWAALLSIATVSAEPVDYATQVQPLLAKYCAGCHNDAEPEAEFSVQSYASLTKGGESEESPLVAFKSDDSRMIQMLLGNDDSPMPPEDEPQPAKDEIALIAQWINEGAQGPTEKGSVGPTFNQVKTVGTVTRPVTSVDWAQDRVAISRFRSVEIGEADSLKTLHTIGDFPGKINSVRFSNDGNRLIVASGIAGFRGDASVWDVKSARLIARITAHNDTLYHAVESPNGKRIATASYDRRIKIWDTSDASNPRELRTLIGHNDAIYDLDFSRSGSHLISAGGDQTVKVWNVATGQRLDTLGQPLQEQFACRFSPDNRIIVGGGRDNRIRVWQFVSREKPQINPLLYARFAHEAPIVSLAFSPDGRRLVSTAEDRTVKLWETDGFTQIGNIENQSDVCASVVFSPDNRQILVGRMDGTVGLIDLPAATTSSAVATLASRKMSHNNEPTDSHILTEAEPNDRPLDATFVDVPARISGRIDTNGRETNGGSTVDGSTIEKTDRDLFRFDARAGQPLLLEVRAARDKSPLDSRIEILDTLGQPVPQVVLRAVRDSYFTFRGKDSKTNNDFRIHNWQEMDLNDYLYSSGEVVKLFLHPRGPDSGFVVYPGSGSRTTFFGTTAMSHALHEPCYIVRPYPVGTKFQPNGLPTFELNYENDDDPLRKYGNDSRLTFVAPEDGAYLARISDVRGLSGANFTYELQIRTPQPDFRVSLSHPGEVHRGSGQEFTVTANRMDGFAGPINVTIEDIPDGLHITTPLIIEAGHNVARGTIHFRTGTDAPTKEQVKSIRLNATATIGTETITHEVNRFGSLKFSEKPKVQLRILPYGTKLTEEERAQLFESNLDEPPTFEVAAGDKIELMVIANRIDHSGRISFGNEDSGRNLPHGVYVDDIGLNGLMIIGGNSEQRFFLSAEDWVQPTTHTFHIRAKDVQNQATWPVEIKVTPGGFASAVK